jgi:hypothetical protein
MAERKKISPILLYAGAFIASYLVICVIMFFILKSQQKEISAEIAAQDTTQLAVDTTKVDSALAVKADTTKKTADTSTVATIDTTVGIPAETPPSLAEVPALRDTITAESLRVDTAMVAEVGIVAETPDSASIAEQRRKVARLIRIVDSMKPADTADVLSKLDDDFAIQVLLRMKERNAAKVLSMMPPSRAARLTAKIGASMK